MQTRILPAASDSLREAVGILRAGGLVALPTETVYGLAADALEPEAVAGIYRVKQRPSFNPLIVHLADASWLPDYALVSERLRGLVAGLASRFWPGPLTLVLPRRDIVPDLVTAGGPKAAFRVPFHPVMAEVLRQLQRPLAAPSANRSGRVSPTTASAVLEELGGLIPLILDGGPCSRGLESTVVEPCAAPDAGGEPCLRILREGPVTREDLSGFAPVIAGWRPLESGETPSSPGQLASHYAPGKKVVVVEDPATFTIREGHQCCIMLPAKGLQDWDRLASSPAVVSSMVLAPETGSLEESAARLFSVLRELDKGPGDVMLVPSFAEGGLGAALMDRLRRAAAHR